MPFCPVISFATIMSYVYLMIKYFYSVLKILFKDVSGETTEVCIIYLPSLPVLGKVMHYCNDCII